MITQFEKKNKNSILSLLANLVSAFLAIKLYNKITKDNMTLKYLALYY